MSEHEQVSGPQFHARCCPRHGHDCEGLTRRGFLENMGGLTLGGTALAWVSWNAYASAEQPLPQPSARKPLVVKPILTYATPQRREQTSWRSWGGIQTQQDAEAEVNRIQTEVAKLQAEADFPVTVPSGHRIT